MKNIYTSFVAALLISSGLSLPAHSAPVDPVLMAASLPVSDAAQGAEKDLVEKGLYKEALLQWDKSYSLTSFADTPSGQAFFALLLFRNNISIVGFDELMAIKDPEKISNALKNIWSQELPLGHQIWPLVSSRLTPPLISRWSKILPDMGLAAQAWNFKLPESRHDFEAAADLFKKLKPESNESAWVQWEMALAYANMNEGKQAGLYFQSLLKSPQTLISKDRIYLASARVFFQGGKFDMATKYYDMVSKNSDYWLESVEEKGWVGIREKDYGKALAQVKTLNAPVFANQVGPEPFYVSGVASIKICDYYGAFKILKDFKTEFKDRLPALQALAQKGNTPSAVKAEDYLESDKSALSLGADLGKMPRLFYRDETIKTSTRLAQLLKQDETILGQLSGAHLGALKAKASQRYQEERQKSLSRMKQLASTDVKELSDIIQKLHVVEVEAIQHMFPTGKLAKNAKGAAQMMAKSSDTMTFPDDGEVWTDELDHYRVNSKGCSAN